MYFIFCVYITVDVISYDSTAHSNEMRLGEKVNIWLVLCAHTLRFFVVSDCRKQQL